VLNQIPLLFCRPICGVAGIQSSQNHVQHSAAAPVALPHCSHAGGTSSALAYRTQVDTSASPMLMSSSPQTPQTQEQNGILDWLRKLRLHKYYPVFKQLTMEKVGQQKTKGEPAVKLPLYSLVRGVRLQTSALRVVEVVGKCCEGLHSVEAVIF